MFYLYIILVVVYAIISDYQTQKEIKNNSNNK